MTHRNNSNEGRFKSSVEQPLRKYESIKE